MAQLLESHHQWHRGKMDHTLPGIVAEDTMPTYGKAIGSTIPVTSPEMDGISTIKIVVYYCFTNFRDVLICLNHEFVTMVTY